MRRYIQRVVETQIGRALLSGQILDGATIRLDTDGDELLVSWRNPEVAAAGNGAGPNADAEGAGGGAAEDTEAVGAGLVGLSRCYGLLVAWMARPTAAATRNIDVSGHRQR
ncbi:MAG: ATP-dependent Clp protease ATP-binding subunit ClpB [Solirubrobacteraceae bacterium]|nr:ATP-dependent Clp protease ATP-binding subunit ClpB [Solirubrobacteraceae bacterium]